ncbi:vacuolar carboxypeptidase Y [Suhomyces tanzawaensis NRRL Y-17324]|uniref:Vacuolar carboxypeptidase Y n=1 Tax=Suhomyces tanzawaensis NRRL Y-17324 TaxID=984487 RepID=A0A1E4SJS8_9ASCO|nr:vacuolar carboxypeptidase Y [Suhomyces tanzawaensis NRRL Y-17324]ODV79761.1 vacuolar carboxypeptidase Y [Suhomyces tanzawaensis NRRL Y-17324]
MNIDILEPFHRIRLPQSSRASAIHYYNNRLYQGLANGDLLVYSSRSKTPTSDKSNSSITLKRSKEASSQFDEKDGHKLEIRFSNITRDNSSIDRISHISFSNEPTRTILAITHYETVKIYEIVGKHLNLIQDLSEVKSHIDPLYIEVNEKRLFLMGSKKKISVYQIVNKTRNIIQFQKSSEVPLKDKVRSLDPYPGDSSKALVGLLNSFLLLNCNTLQVYELTVEETILYNFNHSSSFSYFGLSSSAPSSYAIQISNNEVLLVKDTLTLILNIPENPNDSPTFSASLVKIPVAPFFISFISPLYLLVVYNKKFEIVDYETGDLIQSFQHQINSSQIFACVNNHDVYITSGSEILQFKILDYQRQIDQFLSISGKGSSSGGIKDPHNDLKVIGLEKSISLVTKIDTNSAFFENEEETNAKKKQLVLREFYKKKATILFQSYSKYHESLVEISSDWLVFYKDILALFPDFLNGELRIFDVMGQDYLSEESGSVKSLSHSVIKRISLSDIQNSKISVTTGDSGTDNEAQSSKSIPKPSSTSNKPNQNTQGFSKSQNVRKFMKAVNNLIIYLTDQRRILLIFLTDPRATLKWKGIDITPYDIYPTLKRENFKSGLTHIAEVIDTTLFLCYYHTKPMLLGPLLRLPNNHCNSKIVNECLLKNLEEQDQQPNFIKELLDFYYGRLLHRDALEMLYQLSHRDEGKRLDMNGDTEDFNDFIKGPALTIQYLQKLTNDDMDLILQFSYWVIMEENTTEERIRNGKLVFMNDSYECETYDNTEVLNFFTNVLKIDSLAISYLEWLIFDSDLIDALTKNNTIAKFHTKLCLLYLKKLKDHMDNTMAEFSATSYYRKLYDFLGKTDLYEPWTVLKHIPNTDDKFSRFKIFIYKRLGEHEKSIDVLFNQLDDLDAAIEYCADIYNQPQSKTVGEDLLQKLLEDLLVEQDDNIDSIEKLLLLQGSKMSILKVMTSLPNSFPLNKLVGFLTRHLRETQESLHDGRIVSQLYKVGSYKLQDKIWSIQSQGYAIESSNQLCAICGRRIGYAVLSVDKKDQIVHYGCVQNGT